MGMGNYQKIVTILLIAFLVPSIMAIESVSGQIPKPSVPEFTVNVINNSYDTPTTYSKDPYTGETIASPGRHVDSQTITVTIKNQPFTPTVGNTTYHLCYNIHMKGHFEETWQERYSSSDYSLNYPVQSTSKETVITFIEDYPANAQIDIQVEAILLHDAKVFRYYNGLSMYPSGYLDDGYAFDEASGWSNTQTVAVNTPLFGMQTSVIMIVIVAIVIVTIVCMLVLIKRHKSRGKLHA